jgi:hypothetical protein
MMIAREAMVEQLDRLYTSGVVRDPLADVLRGGTPSDDELGDLVFRDGRLRLLAGLAIEVERYQLLIPGLDTRTVPLDAAISVTLRAMIADGVSLEEAETTLCENYPAIAEAVVEAAILERAFASTTIRGDNLPGWAMPTAPGYFGPKLGNGMLRYKLVGELGSGSSAVVFLAEDLHLAAPDAPAPLVAIKVGRTRAADAMDRYEIASEAARARAIDHPNIVRVYDRGVTAEGLEYIVAEYAPGGSLRWNDAALEDVGAATRSLKRVNWAADIGIGVAKGLQAIHLAGLVHRDLKPDNVLIGADGSPKIADFGIALPLAAEPDGFHVFIESPTIRGSLAFMAPERVRCDPGCNSVRADIFALGGMIVYLMTGKLVNGTSAAEIHRRAWAPASGTPPVSGDSALAAAIPPVLSRILDRCLAPDPSQRYESAGDLAADLERWKSLRPIAWLHTSKRARLGLALRRNPALSAVTFAGILALAVAFTASMQAALAWARQQGHEQLLRSTLETGYEAIRTTKQSGKGAAADALTQVCALEWLRDRNLLFDTKTGTIPDQVRVEIAKDRITLAEQLGQGDDITTWMWRLAQGYWELRMPINYPKEPGLLTRTCAALQRKLGDRDSLTIVAHTLVLAEEYRALVIKLRDTPSSSHGDRLRHAELRQELTGALDRFRREGEGEPMVVLIQSALEWTVPPLLDSLPSASILGNSQ